jgi:hypothetical protein
VNMLKNKNPPSIYYRRTMNILHVLKSNKKMHSLQDKVTKFLFILLKTVGYELFFPVTSFFPNNLHHPNRIYLLLREEETQARQVVVNKKMPKNVIIWLYVCISRLNLGGKGDVGVSYESICMFLKTTVSLRSGSV